MDRWDVFMAVAASYVAIASLVRLMANRRNELVAKIREEISRQRSIAKADEDQDQKAA
ncbi:MAG TPA: hypothetical protein VEQ85_14305 [Lacipirellulaceae bacterium]|nr:hypothetical protein [Lacipirellulaceae bacterium]